MKFSLSARTFVVIVFAFGCKPPQPPSHAADAASASSELCQTADDADLPDLDLGELAGALTPNPEAPDGGLALAGGNQGEVERKLGGFVAASVVKSLYQVSLRPLAQLDRVVTSMPGDTADQKIFGIQALIQNAASQVQASTFLWPLDREWAVRQIERTDSALDRIRRFTTWIPGGDFEMQKRAMGTFFQNFGGPGSLLSQKLTTAGVLYRYFTAFKSRGAPAAQVSNPLEIRASDISEAYNIARLISPTGYLTGQSFADFFASIDVADFGQTLRRLIVNVDARVMDPGLAQLASALLEEPEVVQFVLKTVREQAAPMVEGLLHDLGVKSYQVGGNGGSGAQRVKLSVMVETAAKFIDRRSPDACRTVASTVPSLMRDAAGGRAALRLPPILEHVKFPNGLPIGKLAPMIMNAKFPVDLILVGEEPQTIFVF
jgi:hypothetical protein